MADSDAAAAADLSLVVVITTPPAPDESAGFADEAAQGDGHFGAKALPIQRRSMSTGTKQPPTIPPITAPEIMPFDSSGEGASK